MVFKDYSNYYDWLYEDKNYREECEFIRRVFQKYADKGIKTVLDLGCGTGSHALIFADMDYEVTGVDMSEKMLRQAQNKAMEQEKQVAFIKGNICSLELPQKFDTVVAMFNVLGYQTTNQEVENTIRSARQHLEDGGLFIFDVWFGPAVLKERPSERVKTLEQGDVQMIRRARPVLDVLKHTVEVHYTVSEVRRDKETIVAEEAHLVRFFFYQELIYFMEKNGFQVLEICPFMEPGGQTDENCWNISVIGRGI
ncbi:class I SAM-dependent DNA methyltransferase [Chloroflexota bacterium]